MDQTRSEWAKSGNFCLEIKHFGNPVLIIPSSHPVEPKEGRFNLVEKIHRQKFRGEIVCYVISILKNVYSF